MDDLFVLSVHTSLAQQQNTQEYENDNSVILDSCASFQSYKTHDVTYNFFCVIKVYFIVRKSIFSNSSIVWFRTFNYLETYDIWHFWPRPCRWLEAVSSDSPFSSPNVNKDGGRKGQRPICFPLGKEENNQPPKPVPTSPSGLIYPDFLGPLPSQPTPSLPDVALSHLSFRQNGESGGFPWENMLWDAIRAKNMQALSSAFISQNKTQGFLPSGVSDQRKRGKSKSLLIGAWGFSQTLSTKEPDPELDP